jgi:hypothetical protein
LANYQKEVLERYGTYLPPGLKIDLALANAAGGLATGFFDGIRPHVPDEQITALLEGLRDPRNGALFRVGETVGLLIGLGEDLIDNVAGLKDMVVALARAHANAPLGYQAGLAVGPAGWNAIIAYEAYQKLRGGEGEAGLQNLVKGLWKFESYVQSHPETFLSIGEELGRHLGNAFGPEFSNLVLMERDYYWKGVAIGRWAGFLVMEIALLFIGPEELAVRGAAATAKAGIGIAKSLAKVLKNSKLARKILEILRSVPELAKLLRGFEEGEEILRDVAKVAQKAEGGEIVARDASSGRKAVPRVRPEEVSRVAYAHPIAPGVGWFQQER